MKKVFKVIRHGILSSIQDAGRYQSKQYGISQSGVLDEHAYYWGNYLLGNTKGLASLEISIGQCELLALSNSKICITGADLGFCINAKTAPIWQVITIKIGDTLTWHQPKSGIRTYLSITGGLVSDIFFHSQSINIRESLGNLIVTGQILEANITNKMIKDQKNSLMPRMFIPDYHAHLTLRILFTNSIDFSPQDQHKFCQILHQISPDNNRTAYQLNSTDIKPKTTEQISQANAIGSVQITPDGIPIILLKDCPTIGGYAKIGVVFSLDLAKLAQRSTHTYLNFEPINIKKTQQLRQKFNVFFEGSG